MEILKAPGGSAPGALSVLVLGGYGLIGSAIMRRLAAEGHHVTGAGRSQDAAQKTGFQDWRIFDAGQQTEDGWRDVLSGFDVVVNASGALQDGARDDLTAIHETALARIGTVLAATDGRIVQISAAGVSPHASTEFFRSKARGETALRASGAQFIMLRPTLVMAPAAYGGTALLRAAAALPVLPKVLPNALIQSVHVDDLATAVLDAVEGRIAVGTEVDVTCSDLLSLPDLIRRTRAWLGFPEARIEMPVPGIILTATSAIADLAGRLGWRSPLRSTAVSVLREGVMGDVHGLQAAGGQPCRGLDDIFASLPSTVQERWFARAYLMFPVALVTLAVFWLLSGAIGVLQFGAAQDVLVSRGMSPWIAGLFVLGGALADVALGAAVLIRKWAQTALWGMIAVSLAYLGGSVVLAPDLWLDPLGPMVKVLPSLALTLFTLALLSDR